MSLGWRLPVDGMVGKARRNVEESNAKGKVTRGPVNRQGGNAALKGMSTGIVAAWVPRREAAQAGTWHQREISGEATKSHAGRARETRTT